MGKSTACDAEVNVSELKVPASSDPVAADAGDAANAGLKDIAGCRCGEFGCMVRVAASSRTALFGFACHILEA